MLDATFARSPWFGYTLKHRAVLVIRHAFGSLKHARQKILLHSAFHDLFLVNLLPRRKGRQPPALAGSSCSIPSKCMKNLREKVLGTQLKQRRRGAAGTDAAC